jgi:hypothetical protein
METCMTTQQKVKKLLEHIGLVRMNCEKLGMWMIEQGDTKSGIALIANGQKHDYSKFVDIEFDHLWPHVDSQLFSKAHSRHVATNKHHPEYWGTIQRMSKLHIAEMVCDWKARATEFGTCLADWINDEATIRFKFTREEPVYKLIMLYVDALCDKPFKSLCQTQPAS